MKRQGNAVKLSVETLVMISHCFTLYLPQMHELKGVRMERVSDESGILDNVELMASSHELINGWGSSPYWEPAIAVPRIQWVEINHAPIL